MAKKSMIERQKKRERMVAKFASKRAALNEIINDQDRPMEERFKATLSLAGRTAEPRALPLAVRSGGFGGAEGLAAYLRAEQIDLLIDATAAFSGYT